MRYIILKLICVHVVLELESLVLNNYHIKQYVGYDVLHGGNFYWSLTPLSTICQLRGITWRSVVLA